MNRLGAALAVMATIGCSAAADAAPRQSLLTLWQVVPAPADALGERMVADGDMVLRQALLPTGLAVLDDAVQDTGREKLSIAAGTQLVQASTGTGKAYCALATERADKSGARVENKRGTTLCLLDADGNGRFEGMFDTTGGVGLLMVQTEVPKAPRPCDIGYTVRPAAEVKGDFWVGIRYEQYFNIYGNRMFFTDFGGRGEKSSLTDFDKFKSAGPFPITKEAMGAKLTVLAAEPKGSRIRIDAAMPAQPFAIISYTTTTFIPIRCPGWWRR